MRKIIKNKNLVPVTIADLNLDDSPDLNSTDPVTSRGVATAITEAVGGASNALQEQIDDIAEKAGSGYIPKGPASVATLNGLSGQENGWLYTMTDAGTLTDGSLAVVAGDTVAWDATNSVWYIHTSYSEIVHALKNITDSSSYSSMNDLPKNTTCLVSTTLNNSPSDFPGGVVFTFTASNVTGYASQIAISRQNAFYVRSKNNGTWSSWKALDTPLDFSYLEDYDYIFANILYDSFTFGTPSVAVPGAYVKSNSTVGSSAGFSISDSITLNPDETISIYAGGYNTNVSMISLYDGANYTKKVQSIESDKHVYEYTNTTNSAQTVRLSYSNVRAPKIYIVGKKKNLGNEQLPELSMFETLGVIGDSYASGIIYNSAGTDSETFYNKSWPQILGRKNGINVTNYSFGGARTNTWLINSSYGLPKMLSDEALDAYAIVLSINDRNNGGAEWLGTISDVHVGDPSQNANSFYGCYAKIIENILSHAPNAKIFCIQHAYNATGLPKDYNDAIEAIANLYSLPCVPEFEDEFFTTEVYTQMYGGHPTYVGYAGMADALCRIMRKSMVKYLNYFKSYLPIV